MGDGRWARQTRQPRVDGIGEENSGNRQRGRDTGGCGRQWTTRAVVATCATVEGARGANPLRAAMLGMIQPATCDLALLLHHNSSPTSCLLRLARQLHINTVHTIIPSLAEFVNDSGEDGALHPALGHFLRLHQHAANRYRDFLLFSSIRGALVISYIPNVLQNPCSFAVAGTRLCARLQAELS